MTSVDCRGSAGEDGRLRRPEGRLGTDDRGDFTPDTVGKDDLGKARREAINQLPLDGRVGMVLAHSRGLKTLNE